MILVENTSGYNVYGTIYGNTTWYKSSSPYTLTGNLVINNGVTLTIEPGVIVDLGSYQIEVRGTLDARGTSTNRIVFTSNGVANQKIDFTSSSTPWNEYSSSGCIIDYAIVTAVSMVMDSGAPKISNCYFTSSSLVPIVSNSGSPTITNNVILFRYPNNGVHLNSGAATITGNTISGDRTMYGIYIADIASATISNNNIINCLSGINAQGHANILTNNIINNANDGITNSHSDSTIQGNAIAKNKCGVSGTGNILQNSITNNQVGIWGPKPTAEIKNNNIYGNYNQTSGYIENVHCTESSSIDLKDNWWGTTDAAEISTTIWDATDDAHLGVATFEPFLTTADANSPTVPDTITVPGVPPTPSPVTATPTPATPTPTQSPQNSQQPTPTPPPNQVTPTPMIPTRSPIQPRQTPYNPDDPGNIDSTSIILIAVAAVAMLLIVVFVSKKFSKK